MPKTLITTSEIKDAAVTLAKIAAEGWISWTPTFTNFTLGNGILDCKYQKIGKTIIYRMNVTLGTTSVMGTSPQFTLPVVSVTPPTVTAPVGGGTLLNSGVNNWNAFVQWTSTSVVAVVFYNGNTQYVITPTLPWTWKTNDVIAINGIYEAA